MRKFKEYSFDPLAEERMAKWRIVFGTDEGRDVLGQILSELHCLETVPPTPEVIIRQNIGHWILAELGVMQPGQERAIVDAYFALSPRSSNAVLNFLQSDEE